MTEKGLKYLYDILHAINLIEEFIGPVSDYNQYISDLKTQSAVERQLGMHSGSLLKKHSCNTSGL